MKIRRWGSVYRKTALKTACWKFKPASGRADRAHLAVQGKRRKSTTKSALIKGSYLSKPAFRRQNEAAGPRREPAARNAQKSYQVKRAANCTWNGSCADLILPKSGLMVVPSRLSAPIGL